MRNFFLRLFSLVRSDFVYNLEKEKSATPTLKFWFIGNTVFVLIFSVFALSSFMKFVDESRKDLRKNYPDAKMELIDGNLSLQGIEDPSLHLSDDGSAVLIDTKGETYNEDSLNDYQRAMLISGQKLVEKKQFQRREIRYSDLKESFSLSQEQVQDWLTRHELAIRVGAFVLIVIGLSFAYSLFRLITALWWALIFWVVAKILGVKLDYRTMYLATLNFYFIPLVIETLLSTFGVNIPFSTTVILGILFIMNFLAFKKLKTKEAPAAPVAEPIK